MPPLAANTTRIVLSGAMGGTEEWSCGFAMSGAEGYISEGFLPFLIGVASHLTDMWNSIKGSIATSTTFTAVDGYYYATGTTATEHARQELTPIPGTNGAVGAPNQVCLVATLLTAIPGRFARGRMYLPISGANYTSATNTISNASATTVATAVAAAFTAINAEYPDAAVVVASRARSSNYAVNEIVVDNVYDTQRRRRDKTNATFSATGVVGG